MPSMECTKNLALNLEPCRDRIRHLSSCLDQGHFRTGFCLETRAYFKKSALFRNKSRETIQIVDKHHFFHLPQRAPGSKNRRPVYGKLHKCFSSLALPPAAFSYFIHINGLAGSDAFLELLLQFSK
jgi:hypothetical protein